MEKMQHNKKDEECTFCKVTFLFSFSLLLFVFVYTFMHRADVISPAASLAPSAAAPILP